MQARDLSYNVVAPDMTSQGETSHPQTTKSLTNKVPPHRNHPNSPKHVIIMSVVTKDVLAAKALLLYFVDWLQFAHLLMDFVSHAFS